MFFFEKKMLKFGEKNPKMTSMLTSYMRPPLDQILQLILVNVAKIKYYILFYSNGSDQIGPDATIHISQCHLLYP